MKKILIILLVCITGFYSSEVKGQNTESLWFNINTSLNSLDKANWKYLKAVIGDKSSNRINKRKNSLVYQLMAQKAIVEQMKIYNGDTSLKDAVLNYYTIKTAYLQEDYESIMNTDSIIMQSVNFVDAWISCRETASLYLSEAESELQRQLTTYPQKYNINIRVEPDLKYKNKIELAAQANTYYNKVNLLFLKAFLQHNYLIDAIKRNSVSDIIQSQNAVLLISEDVLKELEKLPGFKGDETLKQTTMNIIQSYSEESEEDIPLIIDFFIEQDNMDRLQTIMDAKNARESTENDRLQFEEAKSAFESTSEKCAFAIYKLRDNQNRMLELWEDRGKEFFKRHAL